jgi:hypothetical protein
VSEYREESERGYGREISYSLSFKTSLRGGKSSDSETWYKSHKALVAKIKITLADPQYYNP